MSVSMACMRVSVQKYLHVAGRNGACVQCLSGGNGNVLSSGMCDMTTLECHDNPCDMTTLFRKRFVTYQSK